MYQIGEVTKRLNISADTLRYYEKIHLIPPISRSTSGLRLYSDKDLSRLKFIRRSQRMGFSLEEIAQLLTFREAPQQAKPEIRQLAGEKLADIETNLQELQTLRNELQLLVNLCAGSEDGCPIIDGLEDD
ncbi:heavy metal-responsive transcriptional regulator [Dasania marina]|uniref:heavy metal-responsive transcriptional regulator n=1 Tax=Dasania marina TaxID=471499 RepID=UPI0030D85792|tara:strand:- start:5309 stop:5698 length:390 start_codon:yes stop_codon:yes gene_type:complete